MARKTVEEMLSITQLAERTGLSRRWLHELVHTGQLEAVELGGRAGLRVFSASFNRWLDKRRVVPTR